MFKKIRASFLTGALIVIPLVLTLWILYFIIDKLNFLLLEPIANILGRWAPAENIEILTKTAIFFLLLLGFTFIGFATRIIILRNIFGFGEKILYRLPMVSNIYRTIKEISFAFFVQKKSIFQRVVLVEYPRKGIYQLGFVTSDTKGEARERTGKSLLNVFVPTTPNPTSGVLVLVPLEETISLNMSVAEAMKMVISGGTVAPITQTCMK
ncbi:MAG: DUF502 domain-containing protein [Candidatus Omnitrophica bacterium]|nr:DUF502 domain-containing protein [Candidatus Omnitrophota bacterium]